MKLSATFTQRLLAPSPAFSQRSQPTMFSGLRKIKGMRDAPPQDYTRGMRGSPMWRRAGNTLPATPALNFTGSIPLTYRKCSNTVWKLAASQAWGHNFMQQQILCALRGLVNVCLGELNLGLLLGTCLNSSPVIGLLQSEFCSRRDFVAACLQCHLAEETPAVARVLCFFSATQGHALDL